ncbi:VTT domain-containing protein [Gordonia sp. L191]|uniref:DedA family protein n=1 Tax=Gordonia sp. L191 TaxID=2982699 RepID=UPI0024BF167B|nr:VTT domain-containing protein [Gordonia sp. L191]WHU47552.1 VTT domain-containing protein [Gordonia sp. L191]
MIDSALAHTTTTVVALPGILDPINVLSWFGAWAFWGLLLVILIESGVLFPVLPGDSLLFVAGMVVAAGAGGTEGIDKFASLWQLLVFIPIAAIIGGQIGYWIGRFIGTEMFKPDARFLKERYLVEANEFFEKHGPITIFLARFVPIVRTLAPIVAGAARMKWAVFAVYNVVGAIVWGAGIVLLGYWLGRFEVIQKLIEPIFILIVILSIAPMLIEWYRRRRAAKRAPAADALSTDATAADVTASPADDRRTDTV